MKTAKQIAVRLYADEVRWLTAEARRRRVSMAILIREALHARMAATRPVGRER